MFGKIRRLHPEANIVSIDYDPGASEANQLNRIKLMISAAKKAHRAAEEVAQQRERPLESPFLFPSNRRWETFRRRFVRYLSRQIDG
mgnify:CR=1 FL=1